MISMFLNSHLIKYLRHLLMPIFTNEKIKNFNSIFLVGIKIIRKCVLLNSAFSRVNVLKEEKNLQKHNIFFFIVECYRYFELTK